MNPSLIFLPSFVMVLLSYAVLLWMFKGRVAGIKKHHVRIQAVADPEKEAEVFAESANSSDNFELLFEMPVLFFIASVVVYVISRVDYLYLALCWLYVFTRIGHSYVHCTTNRVKYRFRFFAASCLVLLLIWFRIAFQIIHG